MIKAIVTLFRGQAAAASEAVADRHALVILDQQIRDSAAALTRARRALAVALAQDSEEAKQLEALRRRMTDLEDRARQALAAGDEALATEAAEVIATLEAEQDASRGARTLFAAEIARLRRIVADAEVRLAELDRGRRIARAAEAVRHLHQDRLETAPLNESTLEEAEATLARLRKRQSEQAAALDALDRMDAERRPADIAERLGKAGFGPPVRPTAADVLARLRAASPS
jgi:phage shock protein A